VFQANLVFLPSTADSRIFRHEGKSVMWKKVLLYGVLLALGAVLLQWLDYTRFAHRFGSHYTEEFYTFAIAFLFLALGVWVGARLFTHRTHNAREEGNPEAVAQLGLSDREMDVLAALSIGLSNKEIAIKLNVSPNTVKTHVARILEKLEAKRRTDAIHRARELGILP
jgi:DNA-binding CsgD family transcriptional regulator